MFSKYRAWPHLSTHHICIEQSYLERLDNLQFSTYYNKRMTLKISEAIVNQPPINRNLPNLSRDELEYSIYTDSLGNLQIKPVVICSSLMKLHSFPAWITCAQNNTTPHLGLQQAGTSGPKCYFNDWLLMKLSFSNPTGPNHNQYAVFNYLGQKEKGSRISKQSQPITSTKMEHCDVALKDARFSEKSRVEKQATLNLNQHRGEIS